MRCADERAARASAWEPGRKQGRVRSSAGRSRAPYLGWGAGTAPRRRKDRGDLAAEGAAREQPLTGLVSLGFLPLFESHGFIAPPMDITFYFAIGVTGILLCELRLVELTSTFNLQQNWQASLTGTMPTGTHYHPQ